MTAFKLAAGYTAYTDADEVRAAIANEGRAVMLPTTTVLTTTALCGNAEA
jgi:hypothetical protein